MPPFIAKDNGCSGHKCLPLGTIARVPKGAIKQRLLPGTYILYIRAATVHELMFL